MTTKSKSKSKFMRYGSGLLAPLPGAGTAVFIVLMTLYPLALGARNYRIGDSGEGLVWRPAALQLDLTWMHVLTDVVAALYGAWCSHKALSPRCPVGAPWNGGSQWRHYGIPLVKGCLICALTYATAMTPSIGWTLWQTGASFPWETLLFGMTMPAILFAVGFTCGVLMGNRWALPVSGLLASGYVCIGFLVVHPTIPNGVFPRHWGSRWMAVFPLADSGMGTEPGIAIDPWMVVVRLAFTAVVVLSSWCACAVYADGYGRSAMRARSLAAWLAPVLACSLAIGTAGPYMWVRSAPFTPVCEETQPAGIRVCSHLEDSMMRQRYLQLFSSFVTWFPEQWEPLQEHPLTVLLGNAFTTTDGTRPYNLTDDGLQLAMTTSGTTVRLHTDTVLSGDDIAQNVLDIAIRATDQWIPAPCAATAREQVFNRTTLSDNADVTAFLLQEMPYRMAALSGWDSGILPGSAQDEAAQAVDASDDERFRDFIEHNINGIDTCGITPQHLLDAFAPDGKTAS
ncbi:hypothetical protein [Bifidobacterium cuniculi]|uniref:Uncharacterized protein n=1 Tax=Bifidobacterium cuniculi TaxID=1688 RepID=A0A087AT44_9BIFI|nr:hypothetical protein [Bifidobacterium cuniculi]KFI61944.1 hypothetical protein BCUN_1849 [Bifidobacterium cuniculi]